jgi:hypothetical protein
MRAPGRATRRDQPHRRCYSTPRFLALLRATSRVTTRTCSTTRSLNPRPSTPSMVTGPSTPIPISTPVDLAERAVNGRDTAVIPMRRSRDTCLVHNGLIGTATGGPIVRGDSHEQHDQAAGHRHPDAGLADRLHCTGACGPSQPARWGTSQRLVRRDLIGLPPPATLLLLAVRGVALGSRVGFEPDWPPATSSVRNSPAVVAFVRGSSGGAACRRGPGIRGGWRVRGASSPEGWGGRTLTWSLARSASARRWLLEMTMGVRVRHGENRRERGVTGAGLGRRPRMLAKVPIDEGRA